MTANSLNDNQTLLEKINQAIPNSIYIFDVRDQNMVWFNDRVQDLYGYTLEELRALGSDYWIKTMHPDDISSLQENLARALALDDGEVIDIEYRFKDRSGTYHWVNDRVTVFSRDENGQVTRLLGVAVDVSDRKQRETTLKKTIETLNLSLSAARMGTWEWNATLSEAHWDERMFEIHGSTKSANSNALKELRKRILPEDHEASGLVFKTAIQTHQDANTTYRIRLDNGEIRHIRCYGRFLEGGAEYKMYGVAWDITEDILRQQQIEDARATLIAGTKMAALGEMSGGIAHEINNPLTVIQARAFQLTQMVDNQKMDPEKIKQAAESISRTAEKIARIIRSLRSFSREGSSDPFDLVPIRDIITDTLEFCQTRFYNHGLDVQVDDIDPELEVECRLIQIEQVLLNLLNNSFDAVHNLEEKWIRIDVVGQDEFIDIRVSDSGHGIPEEQAEKIMAPFFTTKEVGKGTGLGLSISAGIVKSHQGDLFLDPTAKNTTFVIRLPRLQEQI